MMRRCASCRWFDPDFVPAMPELGLDPLGLCTWPSERLPYSLRDANRDRLAVQPDDGATCAQWEPREGAPDTTES